MCHEKERGEKDCLSTRDLSIMAFYACKFQINQLQYCMLSESWDMADWIWPSHTFSRSTKISSLSLHVQCEITEVTVHCQGAYLCKKLLLQADRLFFPKINLTFNSKYIYPPVWLDNGFELVQIKSEMGSWLVIKSTLPLQTNKIFT